MDEVKRFLRFTLPGMVSLGQLLLAIYFSNSQWIKGIISAFGTKADIIGVVAAAFISSGAVGYVLANAYHPLYWAFSCLAVDHLSLVKELISINKLQIKDLKGNSVKGDDLNKRDAWTIITYYWYANVEKSKQLAGLNKVTDRLVDFTHAHGATLLGTMLGSVIWLFAFSGLLSCERSKADFFLLIYWIFLLIIYYFGHRMANKAVECIANAAVLSHMESVGKFPVIVYFPRESKEKSDCLRPRFFKLL